MLSPSHEWQEMNRKWMELGNFILGVPYMSIYTATAALYDSTVYRLRVKEPYDPAHRDKIREHIKTTAPTRMCNIHLGGPIVPRQCLHAMSHSRNPHMTKERYFSHRGTKPHSVGLGDSCVGRKRGWVITIISITILPSRQLLLSGTPQCRN